LPAWAQPSLLVSCSDTCPDAECALALLRANRPQSPSFLHSTFQVIASRAYWQHCGGAGIDGPFPFDEDAGSFSSARTAALFQRLFRAKDCNRQKITNGANGGAFRPLGAHLTNGHVWPRLCKNAVALKRRVFACRSPDLIRRPSPGLAGGCRREPSFASDCRPTPAGSSRFSPSGASWSGSGLRPSRP
jgi:hypothetical protein